MKFSIIIGWWIIPLIITIILFLLAIIYCPKSEHNPGGKFSIPDITPIFFYVPAAFVSLFAWFIWELLT